MDEDIEGVEQPGVEDKEKKRAESQWASEPPKRKWRDRLPNSQSTQPRQRIDQPIHRSEVLRPIDLHAHIAHERVHQRTEEGEDGETGPEEGFGGGHGEGLIGDSEKKEDERGGEGGGAVEEETDEGDT